MDKMADTVYLDLPIRIVNIENRTQNRKLLVNNNPYLIFRKSMLECFLSGGKKIVKIIFVGSEADDVIIEERRIIPPRL